MNNESETPRTDRAVKDCYLGEGELNPMIIFCQEIELEAAQLKAKREQLKAIAQKWAISARPDTIQSCILSALIEANGGLGEIGRIQ